MRLIDIDDLIRRAQQSDSIEQALSESNVVTVIQCKQCVNWCDYKGKQLGRCAMTHRITYGNDFCSHAEEV